MARLWRTPPTIARERGEGEGAGCSRYAAPHTGAMNHRYPLAAFTPAMRIAIAEKVPVSFGKLGAMLTVPKGFLFLVIRWCTSRCSLEVEQGQ